MKINIHPERGPKSVPLGDAKSYSGNGNGHVPSQAGKAQSPERKTFPRQNPALGEVWVKAWCAAYAVNGQSPDSACAAADMAVRYYKGRWQTAA